ncbi:unnamed protein product, partial [Laminaria digitata]
MAFEEHSFGLLPMIKAGLRICALHCLVLFALSIILSSRSGALG